MQIIKQVVPMMGYMTSLGNLLNVLKTEYAKITPITPKAYGSQG
tara:strand:- start:232 stop:363 length:132 start_codon:yes stop_codon:yes gene_type:complete